jgi:hypothetical protein
MPERGLFGYPKPTAEERELALLDPGPTWREFFLYEFAKVWIALGFLIADTIVVAGFLQPPDYPAAVLALAAAIYLEFIAYQYLWYRPPLGEPRRRGTFRRSWRRWVEFGRWTPEAEAVRVGRDPYARYPKGGPDPTDFL